MQSNYTPNPAENAGNNSCQRKSKRVPRRGPGIAALEMMKRVGKRVKKESKLRDRNQPSSPWQNSLLPPSNSQVLQSLQSSIKDHQGVCSSNFTREYYRYNPLNITKKTWPSPVLVSCCINKFCLSQCQMESNRTVELGDTRYNSDIAMHGHANLAPSSRPLLPDDLFLNERDSWQHSGSSPIPFYNFLEVKELEVVTDATKSGRSEADIDLNLKL
ncbi:unnamed protein product [Sphenostylis stenocarpa]|uniref:Uncharacterized protein n=1 Tax=Sphenostylis stenocarpa TaxID=92480 RepID=A0AA86TCS8_9FABA|nr:unnamed protein product [Sphenostylis stenocarpa]